MNSKTVLITGSTSGIGLEIAKTFASAKYNVLFNGLEKEGNAIAESIGQHYGVCTQFSPADLRVSGEIVYMVKSGIKNFGSIDILINNAGIQHVSPVVDFPEEKWNSILAVNLTAAFLTSKAVWKGMQEKGWGRIIHISSVHGLVASENKSAYVASKHGLIGLAKTLALEGAEQGITSNAICPGYVNTPLVQNQISDQAAQHHIPEEEVIGRVLLSKQPIRQFVDARAIGDLALFLASESGKLITGSAISIDGGWSAR
jgi:3-hydroxybutyrate dehydrogenase